MMAKPALLFGWMVWWCCSLAAADQAAPIALSGEWKAPCHKTSLFRRHFAEESYQFGPGQRFSRDIREYANRDCSDESLMDSRTYTGTFTLGTTQEGDGAYGLDFNIDGAYALAFGNEALADMNRTKECGRIDWRRGVRRSLLGSACPNETVDVGTVIHDIVLAVDGKLYFGSTGFFHDGTTPKTRPTKVDKNLAFSPEGPSVAH